MRNNQLFAEFNHSVDSRPGRVWYGSVLYQCTTAPGILYGQTVLYQNFLVRTKKIPGTRAILVLSTEFGPCAAPLRDDGARKRKRGDEGARRGFRRSEASPNWNILSRSCLFATRHASWRSVVRVSTARPTSIEVRSTSSSTGVGGRRVLKARDARSSRRSRIRFNQVQ